MNNIYEIIRRPIITEKTSDLREFGNKYVFEIAKGATKLDVRKAVETLFGARVKSVNTMHMPSKPRRFGRMTGRRAAWKKAVVTLHEGEEIDFFEDAPTEEGAEV